MILRKQNVTIGRTHGRTDNMKTVYPPQTKFAGGIKTKTEGRSQLKHERQNVFTILAILLFKHVYWVLTSQQDCSLEYWYPQHVFG